MSKNAHLTYDERLTIQKSLAEHLSFKEIGLIVGKDPSTISKEVRSHLTIVEKDSYNPCALRRECTHSKDICRPCNQRYSKSCKSCDIPCCQHCPDYVEQHCLRILKPPYVCNGCTERHGCKLQRHLYDAKYAQKEYESLRSESRQGFAVSREELDRIDAIISPLVKQGHSVHHICIDHGAEIMLDEKTIYSYIDAGLLTAGNIDLPRKVRFRVRKKKKLSGWTSSAMPEEPMRIFWSSPPQPLTFRLLRWTPWKDARAARYFLRFTSGTAPSCLPSSGTTIPPSPSRISSMSFIPAWGTISLSICSL